MWENNERMYFMYISLFHMILLPLLFLRSAWNLSGRLVGQKRSLLFYFTLCWMYWSEKKKVFTYKRIKKKLFKNFKQFQNVLLLMPATQRWVFKWETHLLTFLTLGLKMKLSQNQNTCEATHFSGSQTFLIPLYLPSSSEATKPLAPLALPKQCVKWGHWAQERPALGLGLG